MLTQNNTVVVNAIISYSLENVLNKISVLALERKISVRANREELVSKGILLPESPLSLKSEPGELSM